jgi:hypothetical protein
LCQKYREKSRRRTPTRRRNRPRSNSHTHHVHYAEEPDGLLMLDPQLVCYSWITGIVDVAQVVFVRKRLAEIQYFQATITDAQREEFGQLVEETVRRIEAAEFLPHSGARFPQNHVHDLPLRRSVLGATGTRRRLPHTTSGRRP